jgi:hypothetical protein
MTSEPTPTPGGQSFRAERTDDEVVLRFPSLSRLMRAVLPAEAVQHLRTARREQLLALRVIVDTALERIEAAERDSAHGAPRRTEIRVE